MRIIMQTQWIYYDGCAVAKIMAPQGLPMLALAGGKLGCPVHGCPLNQCEDQNPMNLPVKPAARSGEEILFSIHCTADLFVADGH